MTDWYKTPTSDLDYAFDWRRWLDSGDTLISAEFTVSPSGHPDELKVGANSGVTNTRAIVWLSGGQKGVTYKISCKVSTKGGRVEEKEAILQII